MRHLSDVEFVDAVEGRLTGSRLAHAAACAACRDGVERLRGALDLAAGDGADEPSPLFWAHFSSRVSQAIRDEAIASTPWWRGWILGPAAVAAAAVVAIAVSLVSLNPKPAPAPPIDAARVSAALAPPENAALEPAEDLDDDPAWAVVRTAAEDFDWDDARAAGLQAQPGTADHMVIELSEAERIELLRILEQEMKHSGA
jgi:hypothetical protein